MKSIFELKNVSLGYNGKPVITIDEFDFQAGEIYALLGPNGSGKTTLLKTLAGLMKPTRGQILLDGENIYSSGSIAGVGHRRRVSLVMQSPVLFDASLLYNVSYGLRVRGLASVEAHDMAAEAISSVGLKGMEFRNARQLSGGEAQRASIARALALDPEIFLFDEPTGNVDVDNTKIIETIIKNISNETTKTVLFSTHSGRQARRLANNAVHFSGGRLSIELPDHPAGYLWDS